jgi:succinoglycan biosynthesis transport protein ExoP
MRFALWRGKKAAQAETVAVAEAAPTPAKIVATAAPGDIDLRALSDVLKRKRGWIVIPTVLAFVLSTIAVNLITPQHKSEARILIDGRENVFLRPNADHSLEARSTLDAEAVTSQVQLVLSRDLARRVIKQNKLADRPEFDPVLQGLSPLKSVLALFGIGRDPFSMTPEERVLEAYFDRLTAYAVDKSRVIVVEFQSRDPELAARIANAIADDYLVLQQNARREQAKSASQWLSGEIDNLRNKVAEAESRVEDFRSKSSLFIGTNNTTLSNQQMGELNTQLNNARALKSDAEARARLIREMLQGGQPIEASEVLNSELMRRLSEQEVAVRTQLAEQSSTLLDNHPRIKELKAQLADLDRQIRDEAGKISRSLDNDARIAGGRVESLMAGLDQLKKQAGAINGQDVQLRALEREAKAQRDLLEAYLAKYREATTRENIEAAPAEGRIISGAMVSNTPTYPRKLPIVLIATLATLLFSTGLILTGELLAITAPLAAAAMVSAAAMATALAREPKFAPAADNPQPARPEAPSIQPPTALDEIEQLAVRLRDGGPAAHKLTVLGTASSDRVTLTALMLARLLARNARVVLVDLAGASPTMGAVSVEPNAPGLAELMQGEASFSQVITRDRLSRVQLVNAGRPGFDRTLLQSQRLMLAISALLRVYDHVLLDAGAAADLSAQLLATGACAVVVADASMQTDARTLMCEQLQAAGFSDVVMLSGPAAPSDAIEAAPHVIAA